MDYTYEVEKLESGGYVAFCPAMKPVRVFGQTESEAQEKLEATVPLYIKRHPELKAKLRVATYKED